MKFLELYLWCYLYLALYLPISLLIHLLTGYGDFLGILLIGGIMTAILGVMLSFSDGVWYEDEMEPAIVLDENETQNEIKPLEVEHEEPKQDLEPAAEMRTDVDLGQLDADDDDLLC